jgi:hypothetical protein
MDTKIEMNPQLSEAMERVKKYEALIEEKSREIAYLKISLKAAQNEVKKLNDLDNA